ncbi:MAG: adenylate kinase [Chloroflexi bacterium RBG_13_48_17]|jgi:adenylate kinase|nr:MAG: adenylate kinase [Chloroflexi bacterium RBG_13_48_17]
MFLVFLGAPGAGKGTQAAIISRKLGLAHIASGDLFRQAVDEGTELGKLVKSYMAEGALVPDEVTTQLISERLNKPDCKSGCVFDGFPRTTEQARALDKMLAGRGESIDEAIYIEVPEKELLKRLSGRWVCRKCQAPYHEVTAPPKVHKICDKCGGELYQRPDDTEETIKKRLKVYFAQTTPVLDYYQAEGKLFTVDGNLSIEEVSEKVIKALGPKLVKAK